MLPESMTWASRGLGARPQRYYLMHTHTDIMLIHYRCCIYVPSPRPFSSTCASWSLNIFLLIETVTDASSGKCFLQLSLSLAVSKLYFMKTLSGVLTGFDLRLLRKPFMQRLARGLYRHVLVRIFLRDALDTYL